MIDWLLANGNRSSVRRAQLLANRFNEHENESGIRVFAQKPAVSKETPDPAQVMPYMIADSQYSIVHMPTLQTMKGTTMVGDRQVSLYPTAMLHDGVDDNEPKGDVAQNVQTISFR